MKMATLSHHSVGMGGTGDGIRRGIFFFALILSKSDFLGFRSPSVWGCGYVCESFLFSCDDQSKGMNRSGTINTYKIISCARHIIAGKQSLAPLSSYLLGNKIIAVAVPFIFIHSSTFSHT